MYQWIRKLKYVSSYKQQSCWIYFTVLHIKNACNEGINSHKRKLTMDYQCSDSAVLRHAAHVVQFVSMGNFRSKTRNRSDVESTVRVICAKSSYCCSLSRRPWHVNFSEFTVMVSFSKHLSRGNRMATR